MPEGLKYFSEVLKVLEYFARYKISFYDFLKSPGLSEGLRLFSWSFTNSGMFCKLQNIFLWFFKFSCFTRRSKITFLKFGKSWNVLQASKYFSMIFKVSWIVFWQVGRNSTRLRIILNNVPIFWTILRFLYIFYGLPHVAKNSTSIRMILNKIRKPVDLPCVHKLYVTILQASK